MMKTTLSLLAIALSGGLVAVGLSGNPIASAEATPAERPATQPSPPPASSLIVHEWGTFTSFSGSDGVPVGFTPNNSDLPQFVYAEESPPNSKAARLARFGLISMETPVIYFYTPEELRVSVKVAFPKGWITEWYPFAAASPVSSSRNPNAPGQSICWSARLMPGKSVKFPFEENNRNHYYEARETDSVPLEIEAENIDAQRGNPALRGGTVVQREKFLFYRGVGAFPPLVTVKALGGGQVRVKNTSTDKLSGLIIVNVRDGKLGFRILSDLEAGADVLGTIPAVEGNSTTLADTLVKELTATGLYEKEARAMVNTWENAWFGENGTRVMYLVPRAKTEELLPLSVTPTPRETVRVLVGRHDFLTPEQEAEADRQLARVRAAQAELNAAEKELNKIGRFSFTARGLAENRLDPAANSPK